MGLPRYHEQPVLLLMYRTIHNLDFINREKRHSGPFEVTQLINSFLSVVAHPWDRLLDQKKLEETPLASNVFRRCRFPDFPALPVDGNPARMVYIYDLLRVLRNGMAHGNRELVDRKTLRKLRQAGPLPRGKESEIAGIKLWNQNDSGATTWCTALDIYELRQALDGMMRICEKRSLWKEEVRILQDQRDAERRARQAR